MNLLECYNALGVSPDASREAVKRAYRKLVSDWHPDRFAREDAMHPLAEEQLKRFNIAYAEVIKHLNTRPRRYRPRSLTASRPGRTARGKPGFVQARGGVSRGSVRSGAVLNRLTRKFRQMLSGLAPGVPKSTIAGQRTPSGPGPGPAKSGPGPAPRRKFDEVFNEVAGPEADRIRKAAARKKRNRQNLATRRGAPPDPLKPASGKARDNRATSVPPVARIKKVGRIRRI